MIQVGCSGWTCSFHRASEYSASCAIDKQPHDWLSRRAKHGSRRPGNVEDEEFARSRGVLRSEVQGADTKVEYAVDRSFLVGPTFSSSNMDMVQYCTSSSEGKLLASYVM